MNRRIVEGRCGKDQPGFRALQKVRSKIFDLSRWAAAGFPDSVSSCLKNMMSYMTEWNHYNECSTCYCDFLVSDAIQRKREDAEGAFHKLRFT
eukprot:scaffold5511_cov82-Skeletonema_menzelii.AAC.2